MPEALLLDERILGWVFLPITYVTVLVAIAKLFYILYSAASQIREPLKPSQRVTTVDKLTMGLCDQLMKKNHLLTQDAFNARRRFLCKQETGYLIKEGDRPPVETEQSLGAMNGLMEQMKGSMMMILTNIPVMAWINYFFAGFVLARVPFSLTQKFRSMTQSGIDLEILDASYVSGVSFYFLIVFGMNQLNTLFVSDDAEGQLMEQQRKMQMGGMSPMGGGMMGMMNQNKEQKQIFKGQIDSLQHVVHQFAFQKAPEMALKRLQEME